MTIREELDKMLKDMHEEFEFRDKHGIRPPSVIRNCDRTSNLNLAISPRRRQLVFNKNWQSKSKA